LARFVLQPRRGRDGYRHQSGRLRCAGIPFEVGEVAIDSNWIRVLFDRSFIIQ